MNLDRFYQTIPAITPTPHAVRHWRVKASDFKFSNLTMYKLDKDLFQPYYQKEI